MLRIALKKNKKTSLKRFFFPDMNFRNIIFLVNLNGLKIQFRLHEGM